VLHTSAARHRVASTRRSGRGGRKPASARRGWPGRSITSVVLLAFVVFFDLPLVWLLLAITKSGRALTQQNPLSFGSLHGLVANWHQLMRFQHGAFARWLFNSALYAGSALVLTLVLAIPAGYAMALTTFKGRRTLVVVTLVVMLIPNTALVLPVFLEMSVAGLVDNPLSVVLPYSFYPFGVYLAYIYFSTSIPRSLLEAARIDGAGEFQVFARIALPLAMPIVALVGFFSFVQNWNNYFLPFVMLQTSNKYPIQLGLTTFRASSPTLALATALAVVPMLVVFLFSQRYLVTGLTAGGRTG